MNYLYICQGDAEQYGEIAVYHLTDEIYFEDVVYGNVKGSDVLKEGTPVRALRTNDWDALDIVDQSGNIWRLNMKMSETNGYGITIDGRSPDELFDGLTLIWGR